MSTAYTSRMTPSYPTAGEHSASSWPLSLLEEIECGLIVCDGAGRILYVNPAAQCELDSRRVLVCLDRALRPAQGVAGDLDSAVHQAATRGRRTLVRLVSVHDRLLVSVQALHSAGSQEPRVLLMLGRRHPCSDLGLVMLGMAFSLTPAERRVLAALMREMTPREIAAAHSVSLATVRTQVASIREKMGTRTVEGLVLRAAEVPPVAGALRGGGGFSSNQSQMLQTA